MWKFGRSPLVFVVIALGFTNIAYSTCSTPPCDSSVTGITVTWNFGNPSPWAVGSTSPTCHSGISTACGYFYVAPGTLTTLNGAYGWHGYNSSDPNWGHPQAFLNTLATGTGLSFNLASAASFACGDPTNSNCGDTTQYKHPSFDTGYYLSAANTANSPAVTISFGSCGTNCGAPYGIDEFAMYWGSVDDWNTIKFTSSMGTYTFSGSQLTGAGINTCTNNNAPAPCVNSSTCLQASCNQNTSIVVDFAVPSGYKPWTSISFTSCDSSGSNCNPAFEFDNIEWDPAAMNCCSVISGSAAPVPESSSLMLLGTGIAGIVGWLRRRVRV